MRDLMQNNALIHTRRCTSCLPHTRSLSSYLFVAQVVHPCRHVYGELQQLLGGEGGGSAVLLGEGGIGLQHSALPQEVEKVTVGSVLDGDVQVT